MGSPHKPNLLNASGAKRLRRLVREDRQETAVAGTHDSREPTPYWRATRDPIPTLVFMVPLLILYEVGVSAWGLGASRAGAEAWLRHWLGAIGCSNPLILPASIVICLTIMQVRLRGGARFSPLVPCGMAAESLILAVGLVGVSKLVDLGFDRLEGVYFLTAGAPGVASTVSILTAFLGAGIYEEAVFRLAMIPTFYGTLRLFQVPNLGANVLAVTASSLLFSLAHHAGSPGEIFTWYAFTFRWLAGVYFAWVFVVRGFGVAVGTHAFYDILVGYLEWTL